MAESTETELDEYFRERLEVFFYILGRDGLPLGVIQRIINEHVEKDDFRMPAKFTNPELHAWSKRVAKQLLEGRPEW